jgi:hypothetical protein
MGVHIYSGSLVRFYTNNWENEIQRWARENGVKYQSSFAGPTPAWPTSDEATEHLAWMRSTFEHGVSWNDDETDYHTIKLHQEGRDALTLVAAHLHRPDLPMPLSMPADPMDDVALAEAGPKGYLIGPIAAFESSLIVPGDFDGVTFVESPLHERVLTCSTKFLRNAMAFVRKGYWSDSVEPDSWLNRGLIYARDSGSVDVASGDFTADDEPEGSLQGNAEFAFGAYSSVLAFSDKHNTAIAIW